MTWTGLCKSWHQGHGSPTVGLTPHSQEQAQSSGGNWRCTKYDTLHLGRYISKTAGFLPPLKQQSIAWQNRKRLLLTLGQRLKAMQLVGSGFLPHTRGEPEKLFSFHAVDCTWFFWADPKYPEGMDTSCS